jgi:hypothetical protein
VRERERNNRVQDEDRALDRVAVGRQEHHRQEEEKKEEVLSVFRELVRESGSAGEVASTCPGNRYGSGRLGSVSLPTCHRDRCVWPSLLRSLPLGIGHLRLKIGIRRLVPK